MSGLSIPGAPGGQPQGAPPGQPPTGSSPATSPVPNRGAEAGALAKLGLAVRILESLVPALGAGNEAGRDVLKAITSLAKHVPPGGSPGIEGNAMQELQNKQRMMQPQIAAMRAAQQPESPQLG